MLVKRLLYGGLTECGMVSATTWYVLHTPHQLGSPTHSFRELHSIKPPHRTRISQGMITLVYQALGCIEFQLVATFCMVNTYHQQ